jgi:hypothetical protein
MAELDLGRVTIVPPVGIEGAGYQASGAPGLLQTMTKATKHHNT